ncbi:hypothetical protein LOD99_2278 [Oopsacas minuta]|uniref:Uncharacterized protein n=1 Tax=Oopsacas minuta TaxID=111878 RepID=A0AAV7K2K9_9METZ|nr:hypothetical protein LOD99_2278 [Oopsacas minuta]
MSEDTILKKTLMSEAERERLRRENETPEVRAILLEKQRERQGSPRQSESDHGDKAFNLGRDSSIDEYNDDSSSEDDRRPPGMTAEEFDEYLRVDDGIPMAGKIDIEDIIDNYHNEDDT